MTSTPRDGNATARCSCDCVELDASGRPILSVVCYCDDCQEGARRIERLAGAPPLRDPDGGIAYLLYRKDRVKCSKGSEYLQDYRIRARSPTRRVVASCCNSAMFLDFQKGHWFSVYRARFEDGAHPPQMRIQTKFKSRDTGGPEDVPSFRGYPLKFMWRLISARIAMLLRR